MTLKTKLTLQALWSLAVAVCTALLVWSSMYYGAKGDFSRAILYGVWAILIVVLPLKGERDEV